MNKVKCPHCDSIYVIKNGQKNGKQRYQCKSCGKRFTCGKYIKENIKKEKKTIMSKKVLEKLFNFEELNKVFNLEKLNVDTYQRKENVKISSNIERIIENDIYNNRISINEYKIIIEKNVSEEINEIAKRLSKIELNQIDMYLFQSNNNENTNAFIMKVIIFKGDKGLNELLDFFEKKKFSKLRKHYYNVIGKYVSENIGDYEWNTIKKYVYSESKNIKYIITRLFNYLGKSDSDKLKEYFKLNDMLQIYEDKDLYKKYTLEKIEDSVYMTNEDEFKYSLEKIIEKLLKYKIKNNDYLDKYYNSIFTGDRYIEEIFDRVEQEKEIKDRQKHYCILTEYGNILLENSIYELKKSFDVLKYKKKNLDFLNWLNDYTNFIYDIILEKGEESYEKCFFLENVLYGGWASEFLFRCKILNKKTEEKALKMIKKLLGNNNKKLTMVEMSVFRNLLQYTNIEAIKIFANRLKNSVDSDLVLGNNTFHFLLGICERYFGTYEMAKFAFSSKRQESGQYWERLVGNFLSLILKNSEIVKHPIMDNNLIPDYMINNNDYEKNIIIECKLVLGITEFEGSLEKYAKYAKNIYFFCMTNRFKSVKYYNQKYDELIKRYHCNVEIYDYDKIKGYFNFKNKDELKTSINKITQKNILKNAVLFDDRLNEGEKELVVDVIEMTWGKSTLFKSGSIN